MIINKKTTFNILLSIVLFGSIISNKTLHTKGTESSIPMNQSIPTNIIVFDMESLKLALTNTDILEIDIQYSISITETLNVIGNKRIFSSNGNSLYRGDSFRNSLLKVSNNSTLTLDNIIISGNEVINVREPLIQVDGKDDSTSTSTIIIGNNTILEKNKNVVQSTAGGAVFAENGSAVYIQDGSIIRENSSNVEGGGLAIYSGSKLYIQGGIIEYNTTKRYGGAISIDASSLFMSGGLIQYNEVSGTSSGQGGGGIYIYGENELLIEEYSSFITGNSIIKNNFAAYEGGGIVVADSSLHISGETEIIYNESGYEGGGILSAAGANITMDNGNISHNTTTSFGGGISNRQANFKLNNGIISNNTVTRTGTTTLGTPFSGGGIFNEGGGTYFIFGGSNFIMENGEIYGNTASYGAGVINYGGSSTFHMKNGIIRDNIASIAGGGIANIGRPSAIKDDHTILIIDGGSIVGNSASLGGAIFNDCLQYSNLTASTDLNTKVRVYFNSGIITLNQATRFGGGLYIGNGPYDETGKMEFYMNSSLGLLYNNEADESGADIYNNNATIEIIDIYPDIDNMSFIGWFEDDIDNRFINSKDSVIISIENNNINKINEVLSIDAVLKQPYGLKAVFEEKILTFTVHFSSQGGNSIESMEVIKNGFIQKPDILMIKNGYVFDGWYKEEACINIWNFEEDVIIEDTTLYAKWKIIENLDVETPDDYNDNAIINNENIPTGDKTNELYFVFGIILSGIMIVLLKLSSKKTWL
jgi:Listeria/Bacterioides repeat